MPVKVIDKNQKVVNNWLAHFKGERRIRNKVINFEYARSSPSISKLLLTVREDVILAILSLQIKEFVIYMMVKTYPNDQQIVDIAEWIIEDYSKMSIRAIQHCFSIVKQNKEPFNNVIYNKIDVGMIMNFLGEYNKYDYEIGSSSAEAKAEYDVLKAQSRKTSTDSKLAGLGSRFNQMKKELKK